MYIVIRDLRTTDSFASGKAMAPEADKQSRAEGRRCTKTLNSNCGYMSHTLKKDFKKL